MLFGVEPQQASPQQGTVFQVKRLPDFFPRQFLRSRLSLILRQMGQVNDRQRQRLVGNHLLRGPARVRGKLGPQRLVAPDDLVQALLQRERLERAGQAQ